METMENLYKGLFAQYDEDVSAANPYGCNQYGHRGGHKGGASVDMEQRKKQVEDRKKRIRDAKRALSNHKKNVYDPAYVRVHGMDDEPTEKDWKAFEEADNERRRLEYELEKLESESENTPGTSADKGVADGQLDEATRKKYDETWKKAVQEQLENERKFKEMVQKSIDKDPARKAFIEQVKTMGELSGQHVVAMWSNKRKRDSFAKVEDDFYNFVKRGADRDKLRDVPEDKLKYILRDEFVKSDENVVEKNGKPTIQSGDPFNNPLHGEAAMQAWWRKNGDKVLKRL